MEYALFFHLLIVEFGHLVEKIAFVGLGMKKGMIYHGVAINLTNHLDDYQKINSCGLQLPVSKLEDEINIAGEKVSFDSECILKAFSLRLKR